jgi:hypothetical protein
MNKPIYKLLDWIDINKLNWDYLSKNKYAIDLLKDNPNKINWYYLSSNENAIDLLRDNQDKIIWSNLSENKGIFKLDYEKMRKNFEDMEEDILKVVLHPKRVFRYLEEYGFDIDDMFD